MKKNAILLMVFFAICIVFGKSSKYKDGIHNKKTSSKEILANIDRTAHSTHSFQAIFTQTEVDPIFDELYESSGIFYFNKLISRDDNKTPVFQLRFDYMKPEKSITIIDGGKVIIYTPEMSEPQESYLIDDVKMDAFFAPFVSSERMRENYDMVVTDEDAKKVTVMLSPKTDIVKKHFRELRITFNKSNWLPLSIYQVKRNGQKITFNFARTKLNRSISQNMFSIKGLKASLSSYHYRRKAKPKTKKSSGR